MNRILNLIDDELESVLMPAADVAATPFDEATQLDQSHCLFTPLHYEPNYAYPLVVWLHGPDDDECQITRVLPLVSLRNYAGIGPRGTIGAGRGFRWIQEPHHIALAEQRVLSAVAAARHWLNVAPTRIYLAGYECGGTMALRIALAQPRFFAGVLSFGGAFPSTLRPLARLHEARGLKIFLATTRRSRLYPEAQVCQHLRLFHAAGMSVDLRQYPCGDELTTAMLADMDRWIMGQLADAQPAEANQASHRSTGK